MSEIRKHVDDASLLVIVITLVLFAAALFVKGATHDFLLEAGVFLVSVKLIVMAYKNSVATQRLIDELTAIRFMVSHVENVTRVGPETGDRSEAEADR